MSASKILIVDDGGYPNHMVNDLVDDVRKAAAGIEVVLVDSKPTQLSPGLAAQLPIALLGQTENVCMLDDGPFRPPIPKLPVHLITPPERKLSVRKAKNAPRVVTNLDLIRIRRAFQKRDRKANK